MNEGQINKVFHVFGSKSREIVNRFKMCNKSRFYFDYKLAGERYCDFIIIDTSEIKGGNLNQWIEGMTLITPPIIFIVGDKQYFPVDSLLTFTLKLEAKFGTHCVSSLKNHRELVSVLEGVYELLNGFSTVCLDFADFACFLSKGQYYWSETVYSQSIDELKLKVVEKQNNVKAIAKNNDQQVSGLFLCIKGIISPNILENLVLIINALEELEPLFNCVPPRLFGHSNMNARVDVHEDSDLGVHMLWALSDR